MQHRPSGLGWPVWDPVCRSSSRGDVCANMDACAETWLAYGVSSHAFGSATTEVLWHTGQASGGAVDVSAGPHYASHG